MKKGRIAALFVGVLFLIGCEWSGSASDEGWSDSYGDMNFAGTYVTSSSGSDVEEEKDGVVAVSGAYQLIDCESGKKSYTGVLYDGHKQQCSNIVPGTVLILADGERSDDVDTKNGRLVNRSDHPENVQFGSIDYSTGRWIINLEVSPKAGSKITANFSYYSKGGKKEETPKTKSNDTLGVSSVTVNHTGQHIEMVVNAAGKAIFMTGKFTSVNRITANNISTGVGAMYNAQFEVSGDGYSFTGTLEHVATNKRNLQGTIVKKTCVWTVLGQADGVGANSNFVSDDLEHTTN